MDWSDVYAYDAVVFIVSLALFVSYGSLLGLICSIDEKVIMGIVLLVVQLLVGMPASRYANSLGRKAKSKLRFLDPSSLDDNWVLYEKPTHMSDIERIFEKLSILVQKADKKSPDDLNDVAWFSISIWAMLSTLYMLTSDAPLPICMFSAAFLAIVCVVAYKNGRDGLVNEYFDDDLAHLEYYVQIRISTLTKLVSDAQPEVQWKKRGKRVALNDFCIDIPLAHQESSLRFYVGLPSEAPESFVLTIREENLLAVRESLSEHFTSLNQWHIETCGRASIRVTNTGRNLDLTNRTTFVTSPSEPTYLQDVVQGIFAATE